MFWNVGGNSYLCGINAARLLTNNLRHMDDLEPIKRKIYVIRGQRVMLDYDLAALYGVETKALNQAVKRNIARFEGEEFMFQLTKDEWKIFTKPSSTPSASDASSCSFSEDYVLRSQIVTSSFSDNWGGNRRPPYAFIYIELTALSVFTIQIVVSG